MRAVRALKFCSVSVNATILVLKVLTICPILVILVVTRTTELVMVWMCGLKNWQRSTQVVPTYLGAL